MNPSTGEIRIFPLGSASEPGFVELPDHLVPAARQHHRRHGSKPVNLKGKSKLATFARTHTKGAHGRAKNRPQNV